MAEENPGFATTFRSYPQMSNVQNQAKIGCLSKMPIFTGMGFCFGCESKLVDKTVKRASAVEDIRRDPIVTISRL
jgi:hypothetical protein